MNQYTIRQATATDATAMHRVRLAVTENRLVSMALTEQDYVAATQQIGRGWVAEVDGEVVGFAVGNAQTGNIWALFVEPGTTLSLADRAGWARTGEAADGSKSGWSCGCPANGDPFVRNSTSRR